MCAGTGPQTGQQANEAMPDSVAPQKPRLGVLFVHGIGEQPEGETLIGFGDPLVRWLRRWLSRPVEGAAAGTIEVREAHLQRDSAGVASPPHALLDVEVRVGDTQATQQWVFAEHWWAGTVRPPKFSRLAGWLVTVGLWVIVSHATQGTARDGPRWRRSTTYWTRLVVGLLLAIALQLLVGVLWLLALLPLPWIGEALTRWLLRLTSVLGDSYVLSESDLNRAAIVSSTRAAILWLAARCEHVVVVAHSQGGAIAHLALRTQTPVNVRTLVTFGSGLAKLEALLNSDQSTKGRRGLWIAGPVIVGAVAGLTMLAGESSNARIVATWAMGLAIVFAVILVHVRIPLSAEGTGAGLTSPQALRWELHGVRWVDIFATHDPVPNGRYPHAAEWGGVLTSIAITNRRSATGDHTSYWTNPVDFVSRIGEILGEVSEAGLVDRRDHPAMAYARETRARRSGWHLALTSSGVLALAIALTFDVERLRRAGLAALAWMGDQPWPFTTTMSVFGWLRDVTGAQLGASGPILLALTVPLGLLAAWRATMGRAWNAWDEWLLTLMHVRVEGSTADDTMYRTLFVVGAIAPPLVAILLVLSPAIQLGAVIAGALVTILTLLAVHGLARRDADLRARVLGALIFLGFALYVAAYAAGFSRVAGGLLGAFGATGMIPLLRQAYAGVRRLGVRAGVSRRVGRWLAVFVLASPALAAVITMAVWIRTTEEAPWTGALPSAAMASFYAFVVLLWSIRWVLRRMAHRRRERARSRPGESPPPSRDSS